MYIPSFLFAWGDREKRELFSEDSWKLLKIVRAYKRSARDWYVVNLRAYPEEGSKGSVFPALSPSCFFSLFFLTLSPSFSGAFLLSQSFLLDFSVSPNAFKPLKNSPSLSRRTAIRLHRPTARRAAFASNTRQGVFFFFFSFFFSTFFCYSFIFSLFIPLRNIPLARVQRGGLT